MSFPPVLCGTGPRRIHLGAYPGASFSQKCGAVEDLIDVRERECLALYLNLLSGRARHTDENAIR